MKEAHLQKIWIGDGFNWCGFVGLALCSWFPIDTYRHKPLRLLTVLMVHILNYPSALHTSMMWQGYRRTHLGGMGEND